MKANCRRGRHGRIIFMLFVMLMVALPVELALMLLLPETGSDTYSKGGAVVDMSHTDKGYIMVKRKSKDKRQKLIVKQGKNELQYDINGNDEFEVIPLQYGSGKYNISFYEQKSGSKYATVFKDKSISANLEDENICFLYPNQYVNYDENTKAIAIADELCAGLSSDKEKYSAIAGYIKSNIVYDYMKAMKVTGGDLLVYLPNQDATLESKMGICFDFASLAACMLRSQGVTTKLVIGMAGNTYHSWNEVLIEGNWARADLTFAVTGQKIDPSAYVNERVY